MKDDDIMSDIFDLQYPDSLTTVSIGTNSFSNNTLNSGVYHSTTDGTMAGSLVYTYPSITSVGSGTSGHNGMFGPITINDSTSPYSIHAPGKSKLSDLEIDGKLTVNGVELSEAIKNIEERLAILHPNKELEEKWENLKELGRMYRELEAEILEKEKIYEILKR